MVPMVSTIERFHCILVKMHTHSCVCPHIHKRYLFSSNNTQVTSFPFPCIGCSAQTVESFSLTTVNCQSLGIVSLTDSNFNEGTVCGTVNNATANYICDYLSYGTAVAFGTAADKG